MRVAVHKQGLRALPSFISIVKIKRIVRSVFRQEKSRQNRDVNVIFVDNKIIRRLNRRFLNENGVTDVIAFPYAPSAPTRESLPFGDIYISVPAARSNAARFGAAFPQEIIRLIIHGTLHLLGYDDHSPRKRKAMWEKQENLVSRWTNGHFSSKTAQRS